MIRKERVTEERVTEEALLSKFWEIYVDSFPATEQRTLDNIREVLKGEHAILNAYFEDDEFIGFVMFWDYPEWVYGEFFAVDPSKRNGGYGSKILRHFVAELTKPLILEIDYISDQISLRRCGLYLREGFVLNKFIHTPTAYNNKDVRLDMHIMSYKQSITQQMYDDFNRVLVDEIMSNLY